MADKKTFMNEKRIAIIQIETSCKTTDELLNKARDASREQKTVIQAFDPDAVLSKKHLQYSFSQAFKACEKGTNIAKNLENEFLLRTAATRRISEAITRAGTKNPKKTLLAIITEEKNTHASKTKQNSETQNLKTPKRQNQISEILERLEAKKTKWIPPSEKTIAKRYQLNEKALENYTVEQLLIEKIALIEIED